MGKTGDQRNGWLSMEQYEGGTGENMGTGLRQSSIYQYRILPAWVSSQWSMPASVGSARGQEPVPSMWAHSPSSAAFSRCSPSISAFSSCVRARFLAEGSST